MDKKQNECKQDDLLKQLMELDFVLIELNLYLNTHPCDTNAINLFNCYAARTMMLKNYYQSLFGPLMAYTFRSGYPWQWINSPWPWQIM